MGLISHIKDILNNHRLNKAEKWLKDGRRDKGEQLLRSLLDKHPLAAAQLAEHYRGLAKQASIGDTVKYYQLAVELERKTCDIKTYNEVLEAFANDLFERAGACFDTGSYNVCRSLLSAINSSKCKTRDAVKLESEAQINLIFKEIETVKSTDFEFSKLIETFKREWNVVKNETRAKKSATSFCEKLIRDKRYYTSMLFLEIVDDKQSEKILDNAWQIIHNNDIEASAYQIKGVVVSYGKNLVFRSKSDEEAISIFDACWKASDDSNFVLKILNSNQSESVRDAVVSRIIAEHKSYLSSSALLAGFSKWVYDYYNPIRSLQLLEELHSLGYDVENYYIDKLRVWISSMSCDQKIDHLYHAKSLYPYSGQILDDLFDCAKWYLDHQKDEKAIEVADSIIANYSKARIIKAQAIYHLAKNEADADKKVLLLRQAENVLGSGTGEEHDKVLAYIRGYLVIVAESFYKDSERKKSYDILRNLSQDGYEQALFVIAKHRLNEVREGVSVNEKQDCAVAAIKEIRKFRIPSITKNVDYSELWNEYINAFIFSRTAVDNNVAIKDFEGLLKDIKEAGFDVVEGQRKQGIVVKQIINRKYLIARDLELSNQFESAGVLYQDINKLEACKTPTLSALRFILCKLKIQNATDILAHKEGIYSLLKNSAEAFKTEKEDIAYRFSLVLLKSGEDKEALSVLKEFLPNEVVLKKACEQGAMIKAKAKLEDFNNKIDAVLNKTLSSADAIYFVNHIKEYAEVIDPILSIPVNQLRGYRNKLKNYAIFKLFDEDRFAVAFEKMLKEHPDYLGDLTALRNIALVCLNMAEAKQLTESNYQEVISVWLTAIYQERLFIKSLDYTSWDDQYTFSLDEAYGHFNEDTVGDLPDNVNFNYYDPDDNNTVYIKDVQRVLLDRFEAAISENQQYHMFFTEQKDAMDAFIALNLDEKCRLVTPYLASKDETVFENITDALEQERESEYDNWEDVIAVGALYHLAEPIYSDFSSAKEYYQKCMDALDSRVVSRAKQAFMQSKISMISVFDKLHSALVSNAISKVSALNANTMEEFRGDFNFYMVVCDAIKDNTLSFVFSKYVMRFVVGEVNDKRISLAKAADYILSIFLLDPTNEKVKDNLSTLFNMLIEDTSDESQTAVKEILNRVKSIDSTLYQECVMHFVVVGVNENRLSLAKAADHILPIFLLDPANDKVKDNLSTLFGMLVHDDTPESKQAVNSILNKTRSVDSTLYRSFIKVKEEAEIAAELDSVAKQVKDGTMKKNRALERTYQLYCSKPNNPLICHVLAVLCDVCIMDYVVGNIAGRVSVENTLNALKNNKSTEFKKNNDVFKQRYDSIWRQLSRENRYLILHGFGMTPGSSLNENGIALKKGLDYMKNLGDFSDGPLFGVF